METHYQKGFDREGREFTTESKRDTNWGLIISLIVCGILVIAFAINIAKNYYEDKFQNEKEKLEMTTKNTEPVRTRTIVKEVPREKGEETPIVINLQTPETSAPVAVAPVKEGNSFDDFSKWLKELVSGQ